MNNTMFIARSLAFYPGYFEDNCDELSDEIILPAYSINRLIDSFEDNETLYINLTNTDTNLSYIVTIGTPHNYDKNTIFAPQWILELIGCNGNCDSVIKISKADTSIIPSATKIVIKPLDPIAFELDTRQVFEKAFMNLHSIKEGITIPIPVPQLGKDYLTYAHIEKVEPEPISRIVNSEVEVEFINEFEEKEPVFDPIATSNTFFDSISSSINNPIVTPHTAPILGTSAPPIDEAVREEQRKRVRESWLKRFQNSEEPR